MEVSAIPRLSWGEFLEQFQWRQGQHVTLIGPTESGKTTLALEIMERALRTHPWRVVFATKRRDPVSEQLDAQGYVRVPRWVMSDPDVMPRVVLHPPLPKGVDSLSDQRGAYREALMAIFRQGGWLAYLDETRYITDPQFANLKSEVELLLMQGRSLGVTVMASAQRPRHIPLLFYDQATHLFFWQAQDESMASRLGEIGGRVDPRLVTEAVGQLYSHQVLYVNPRTGEIIQTEVEV